MSLNNYGRSLQVFQEPGCLCQCIWWPAWCVKTLLSREREGRQSPAVLGPDLEAGWAPEDREMSHWNRRKRVPGKMGMTLLGVGPPWSKNSLCLPPNSSVLVFQPPCSSLFLELTKLIPASGPWYEVFSPPGLLFLLISHLPAACQSCPPWELLAGS